LGTFKKAYGTRHYRPNFKKLLEELKEEVMAKTAPEVIVEYLETRYEKDGTYRCTSAEVADAITKSHPQFRRTTIMQTITVLKKAGTIIGLDEKVPGKPGATYFALVSALDKETSSTTPVAEKEKSVSNPTPVDPMDKISSQLGELLSKVNGLVNGYATIVNNNTAQQALNSNQHNKLVEVITEGITEVIKNQQILRNDGQSHFEELKSIASGHVTVDGDKLADLVNARLQDLKFENSLIYQIREEMDNVTERRLGQYTDLILEKIQVPSTVSNSDDYKEGIKAGIALAAEMGLTIKSAD
jgi:hypothetical protein